MLATVSSRVLICVGVVSLGTTTMDSDMSAMRLNGKPLRAKALRSGMLM